MNIYQSLGFDSCSIYYNIDWRPLIYFLQKNQVALDVHIKAKSPMKKINFERSVRYIEDDTEGIENIEEPVDIPDYDYRDDRLELPSQIEHINHFDTDLATLPDLIAQLLTNEGYHGFKNMPFIDPLEETSPPVNFDYVLQNKPNGTAQSIVHMIREIAENTQIFQLMNQGYVYQTDVFQTEDASSPVSRRRRILQSTNAIKAVTNTEWQEIEPLLVNLGNGRCLIGSATCIKIPSDVKVIPIGAFKDSPIKSVMIPEGVKNIDDSAFAGCKNLTEIMIPASVIRIGENAFDSCEKLQSLTFHNGLHSIGDYAFSACSSLTSVMIPATVKEIGECIFDNCYKLQSVQIADESETFASEDGALYDKAKTNLLQFLSIPYKPSFEIPEGVTHIKSYAFTHTNLREVVLPKSMISIESFAFAQCKHLNQITISEGTACIEHHAFMGCSNLKKVLLPNSVVKIGEEAFAHCEKLVQVIFPDEMEIIETRAFYECRQLTEVTIPDGITCIEPHTFTGCTNLEKVILPNSVVKIGEEAFAHCEKLAQVVLPEKMETIESSAFYGCYQLTAITIPDGITFIEPHTFTECTNLEKILIPDSVEKIGEEAFANCEKLAHVILPSKMEIIGSRAFYQCSQLSEITIPEGISIIEPHTFAHCTNLNQAILPESVTGIRESAFAFCEMLEKIVLPNSVKQIETKAFYQCSRLTEITIPEGIKHINPCTFAKCADLKRVTLPNSIIRICEEAFYQCSQLTEITIPEGIWSIESCTFAECTNLKKVKIPDSVNGIQDKAFYQCERLEEIVLPQQLKYIYEHAFQKCTSLTTIRFPEELSYISANAFESCNHLEKFIIGDTIPYHLTADKKENPFASCSSLCTISYFGKFGEYELQITEHDIFYWLSRFNKALDILKIRQKNNTLTSSPDIELYNLVTSSELDSIEIPKKTMESNVHTKFTEPSKKATPKQRKQRKSKSLTIALNKDFQPNTSMVIYKIDWRPLAIYLNVNQIMLDIHIDKLPSELLYENQNGTDVATLPDLVAQILTNGDHKGICEMPFIEPLEKGSPAVRYTYALNNRPDRTAQSIVSMIREIAENTLILRAMIQEYAYRKDTIDTESQPSSESKAAISEKVRLASTINKMWEATGSLIAKISEGRYWMGYLQTVTIPNDIINIPDKAFCGCSSMTSVTLPNSVQVIGKSAFAYCSQLQVITIPSSVTDIEASAFQNCTRLSSITLNDGLESIGEKAFENCTALTSVVIPKTVSKIGAIVFWNCSDSLSIQIAEDSDYFVIEDGILYSKDKTHLVQYPVKRQEAVFTIPEGVTHIEKRAFYSTSLTEIKLPKSLEEIGMEAFAECNQLSNIAIPEGVTTIGSYAFHNCSGLTQISLPDSITKIDIGALENCSSLKKVVLPKNLTVIDDYVFRACTKLVEVEFPEQLSKIRREAFDSCYDLQRIIVHDKVPESLETELVFRQFKGCERLHTIRYIGKYGTHDFSCNNRNIYSKLPHIHEALKMLETKQFEIDISSSMKKPFLKMYYAATGDEAVKLYL